MIPIDNAKLILQPFFFNPTKPKYIREIAKNCSLSYERVQHYLKELEKIKALKFEIRGKIKEYSINRKHDLIPKIFSFLEMERKHNFYSKNSRLMIWLQTAINEIFSIDQSKTISDVKFVILFGSTARGEAKKESDIDILIVSKNIDNYLENEINKKIKKKLDALSGRNFSMHILEIEEFRKKWKKEPVYATIWLDHIILYGEENFWNEILELGEPI